MQRATEKKPATQRAQIVRNRGRHLYFSSRCSSRRKDQSVRRTHRSANEVARTCKTQSASVPKAPAHASSALFVPSQRAQSTRCISVLARSRSHHPRRQSNEPKRDAPLLFLLIVRRARDATSQPAERSRAARVAIRTRGIFCAFVFGD
jgi:hypothetical protein